ncbi:MAG: hypothetical protein GXP22_01390 [Gammaproteobacteria bacterium]|nr:hypothetical protein [Gammaproteobacteria bacterium]
MDNSTHQLCRLQTLRASLLIFTIMLLSACGGGGGGSSSSVANVLSGTAATGAPIAGYVYITDINGIEINVPIQADGSYSIDVSGMTAPFILRAIPNDSNLPVQYSYATASGTVNITPLTSLALFLANNQEDLDTLRTNWANRSGTITAWGLTIAQAKINANFYNYFTRIGLDPSSYNFFSAAFNADGSGFDELLDTLQVNINMYAGSFNIRENNNAFVLFYDNVDLSRINTEEIGGIRHPGNYEAVIILTMTYSEASTDSPYNNGDQALFIMRRDGTLLVTDQLDMASLTDNSFDNSATIIASDFNLDSLGQYVWSNSNNTIDYTLLFNYQFDLTDSNGNLLGYFTPVTTDYNYDVKSVTDVTSLTGEGTITTINPGLETGIIITLSTRMGTPPPSNASSWSSTVVSWSGAASSVTNVIGLTPGITGGSGLRINPSRPLNEVTLRVNPGSFLTTGNLTPPITNTTTIDSALTSLTIGTTIPVRTSTVTINTGASMLISGSATNTTSLSVQ